MRFSRGVFSARLFIVLAASVTCFAVAACSKDSSSSGPTTPSPTTADVAGTWTGTASDSSGPGQMTWQLTQSGASFSGSLVMTDTDTGATGRGTVSGTLTGTSVQFSMAVPAGGFDAPYGACSATVSGTAIASAAAITGTYAGTSSCSGTITSGQINLSKR